MHSALPAYAELHCITNFTFLRGASHPEELVTRAAGLGYRALAITDECSLAGIVRAHGAAKEHHLKLIVGAEFSLADGFKLVLLAPDRNAYGNLSQLITTARRRSAKGQYRITWDDISANHTACLALLIPTADPQASLQQAQLLRECFGDRAWIAAELLRGPDDRSALADLRRLAHACRLPLVAAGDVHMHVRSRRPLQDVLTAIRVGIPVAATQHMLYPNAERHLRMRSRLGRIYSAELLDQTVSIAQRCEFSLDCLRYEYPEEIVPQGKTPSEYLRELTEAGLRWRFPKGVQPHIRKLIEHELTLIGELRYEAYFLTVYDIVKFARAKDILCQGRGSAANSVVCYALGITEVDPQQMTLLFERFISRERNEPPDIDVDFEHQRREEVIQCLYAKYGRDRAAIAATVITYHTKSAIRDVGKALGLDLPQVDRLNKSLAWWDDHSTLPQRLTEAGFADSGLQIENLIRLVDSLIRFPRHLSQHTGGFVFSRGLLSRLVPIENAAMPERSVIQWDKDDLDAVGLLKVDVLALGMLTAIKHALAFISQRRGIPFAMTDIPREDPDVYEMIQHADTVGVFQIESRAQMSMLPRLKPKEFYDLVIEVAIVRPGPIQGGMVHPYLRRRAGEEDVSYPSPEVKSVLKRTLGVPIFQEQVMQLAVVAAGFTPGEADKLRRSMATWRHRGGIDKFHEQLIAGMTKNGYKSEYAEQLYQQFLGFGEYGFPESHSASFAWLAYVSAWIKCYEPAVFLAALLNSQPMGFYAPAQLLQDARRHGVQICPVDTTASAWNCALEPADDPHPAVRLGLRLIDGFNEQAAQRVLEARIQRSYDSVLDLARRARLNRRELKALADSGALSTLAPHRRIAHWLVAGIEALPAALLAAAPGKEILPTLAAPTEGENLIDDYASLGFTLGRHPLALLRPRLRQMRLVTAQDLRQLPNGRLARAAGIVTGRQRPATAAGIVFVTLEDETGSINVVVWRNLVEKQRRELLGSRLMGVYGVIERNAEVVHLVAKRLVDHSVLLGQLKTASRDFH